MSPAVIGRRPRDRKAQVLEAAATLFAERGFAAAGMDEIAASVGVTGSALYRHFPGKEALLAAVLETTAELLAARTARTDATLDELVAAAVAFAVDHPARLATSLRERNRLTGAPGRRLRALEEHITALWADRLRQEIPALDEDRIILRRQAAIGAVATAALRLPSAEEAADLRGLLTPSVRSLLAADPVPEATATPGRTWQPPASRRDQVLAAALALFGERGFHGVGIDEIGESVGITGSGVYRHFASKAEILVDAYDRAAARVQAGNDDALSRARSADEALGGLVSAYAGVALDNRDLILVTSREGAALPASERSRFSRSRRALRDTWVAVLAEVRPGVSDAEARLLVATTLSLINSAAAVTDGSGRLSGEVSTIAIAYIHGHK